MNNRGRILIADDDASSRTIVVRTLGQEYECDCVVNGQEAAAALQSKEYHLLISDIEMPGNHDLKLIRDLPQLQAGLPVILMTGYPSVESAVCSVGLSVAAYLVKPFRPDQLVMEVNRAIERYRCYQAVLASRQRLRSTCDDLARLEECLRGATGKTAGDFSHVFLELIWHNIASSLRDWRQYTETTVRLDQDPGSLKVPPAAPPEALMSALWETIAVLEKTKVSFKSKDLGELRRKLENLLRGEPRP